MMVDKERREDNGIDILPTQLGDDESIFALKFFNASNNSSFSLDRWPEGSSFGGESTGLPHSNLPGKFTTSILYILPIMPRR